MSVADWWCLEAIADYNVINWQLARKFFLNIQIVQNWNILLISFHYFFNSFFFSYFHLFPSYLDSVYICALAIIAIMLHNMPDLSYAPSLYYFVFSLFLSLCLTLPSSNSSIPIHAYIYKYICEKVLFAKFN